MSECVIEVNNITKSFKVYLDRSNSIKDFIIHSSRRKYENRRVLRGISFKVRKGEAIGLIGRNGCGKSTTLKMLTRIMYPDTGSIRIKGRVSSLIELGAGFHPDMSGRENIYINASIFGLTKKEIDKRVEDIIEFSELEGYIDNPVRTYSSGMYMRLAFSVAINVDADVLLIDEILAVGDANFQAKCFQKLREIKKNGTTIVIVSHALNQIESICERSIWIEEGIIKMEGQPRKVHREYLKYMGLERTERELEKKNKHGKSEDEEQVETVSGKIEKESASTQREGNHKVLFKKVCLLNSEGQETTQFETGDDVTIYAEYKKNEDVKDAYFAYDIIREDDGMYCCANNSKFRAKMPVNITKDGCVTCKLKSLPLMPQRYFVDFILKEYTTEPIDIVRHAVTFEIFSDERGGGIADVEQEWNWTEKE